MEMIRKGCWNLERKYRRYEWLLWEVLGSSEVSEADSGRSQVGHLGRQVTGERNWPAPNWSSPCPLRTVNFRGGESEREGAWGQALVSSEQTGLESSRSWMWYQCWLQTRKQRSVPRDRGHFWVVIITVKISFFIWNPHGIRLLFPTATVTKPLKLRGFKLHTFSFSLL